MVRKYNKVFVTGDTHLGDVVFNYQDKLVEAIKQDDFDAVIFGGDTFDPWRGGSVNDILAKYDQLFKFLQKLKSRVIFIAGNHDPNIEVLKKLGFTVRQKFKYIGSLGERVKIIHGHEFDDACRRWEFVTKRIAYVENKINQGLTKINNEAFIRFMNLVRINKIDLNRVLNNFRERVGQYRNTDVLVFGHTHSPMTEEQGKVKFYNWGAWQKEFGTKPHIIIHKDGKLNNIELQ
ncbi:MAG: hypothetical protein UT02_C0012G0003 [Parcubacteria group bacterium GW2011_GWC2_38_7]|nr:MAG: hypothetical protein UT02_C0012G0003 [Parcubacteria group bacterium GW2011_GWC2_38_7]